MKRLCFIHGWAYSPDLWTEVEGRLKGYEITKIDLGFFGKAFTPIDNFDVIITHSYGLMWLLKNKDIKFKKLVSISGIASFVQSPELPNGVPKSQIRAMRQQLKSNPQGLLEGFYKTCGDDQMESPGSFDSKALSETLIDMETLNLSEKLQDLDLLALASKKDRIVSAKLSEENFASKPILWHDSTSHILPKTHADWCAAYIEDFINA